MYSNQPIADRYRETAIRTANPLELVVILYDGAIQSMHEARAHLECRNIAARVRCINKGVSILSELQASLNLAEGGQIAESLDRLYTYMKLRIFAANLQQNAAPLAEVIQLLESLRSAWSEVARRALPNPVQPPPHKTAPQGIHNTASLSSLSVCG